MRYAMSRCLLVALCLVVVVCSLVELHVNAQNLPSVDANSDNFIRNRLKIQLGDGSLANAKLVFYSPWVNQKQPDKPILPNYVYLYFAGGSAVALADLGYDTNNRGKVEVCKLTSQQVVVAIDGTPTEFPSTGAVGEGTLGYLYVTLDWMYQGSLPSTASWINSAISTNPDFQDLVNHRLRLREGLGIRNIEVLEPVLAYATSGEEVWLYTRRFQPSISNEVRDTDAAVKLTRVGNDTKIEVTKNGAASVTVEIDGNDVYTFPLTKISNGVGLDIGYWSYGAAGTSTGTLTAPPTVGLTSTGVQPRIPGFPLEAILLGLILAISVIHFNRRPR